MICFWAIKLDKSGLGAALSSLIFLFWSRRRVRNYFYTKSTPIPASQHLERKLIPNGDMCYNKRKYVIWGKDRFRNFTKN